MAKDLFTEYAIRNPQSYPEEYLRFTNEVIRDEGEEYPIPANHRQPTERQVEEEEESEIDLAPSDDDSF